VYGYVIAENNLVIMGLSGPVSDTDANAYATAINIIADQIHMALKDAGLNIDSKGHQDATFGSRFRALWSGGKRK